MCYYGEQSSHFQGQNDFDISKFFYFSLLTLLNVSTRYATNLFPFEQQASILANPEDVKNRIIGSKMVVGMEMSMNCSTWGVKICIWFFLMKLW